MIYAIKSHRSVYITEAQKILIAANIKSQYNFIASHVYDYERAC